jgi:hypothetical protein
MQKCQQRVVKLGNIKKGISDEQLRFVAPRSIACVVCVVCVVCVKLMNSIARLKQNIRLSLAGELQELSSVFRQSQKSYLQSTPTRYTTHTHHRTRTRATAHAPPHTHTG